MSEKFPGMPTNNENMSEKPPENQGEQIPEEAKIPEIPPGAAMIDEHAVEESAETNIPNPERVNEIPARAATTEERAVEESAETRVPDPERTNAFGSESGKAFKVEGEKTGTEKQAEQKERPATRWEKIREFAGKVKDNPDYRKQIAKTAATVAKEVSYRTVGTIFGVKSLIDLGLAMAGKGDIAEYRRGKGEVKEKRTALQGTVDSFFKEYRKGEAPAFSARVKELDDRIKGEKYLPDDERKAFRSQLAHTIWEYRHKEEKVDTERNTKVGRATELYLQNKVSGFRLGADALNTVFTLGGMPVLRGAGYALMALAERAQKAKLAFAKQELAGTAKGGRTGFIVKDMTVNATVETARSLAFRGKKEGSKHIIRDFMEALGTVTRGFGLAGTAFSEIAASGVSGGIEKSIAAFEASVSERGVLGGALAQMGSNFGGNAERMLDVYLHPVDTFEKSWGAAGKAAERFFSGARGGTGAAEIPKAAAPVAPTEIPKSAEIAEGGNVWRAAREIAGSNKLSNEDFNAAWEHSTVEINGKEVPIAEVGLVHAGDKVVYVPGEKGGSGRFEVTSGGEGKLGIGAEAKSAVVSSKDLENMKTKDFLETLRTRDNGAPFHIGADGTTITRDGYPGTYTPLENDDLFYSGGELNGQKYEPSILQRNGAWIGGDSRLAAGEFDSYTLEKKEGIIKEYRAVLEYANKNNTGNKSLDDIRKNYNQMVAAILSVYREHLEKTLNEGGYYKTLDNDLTNETVSIAETYGLKPEEAHMYAAYLAQGEKLNKTTFLPFMDRIEPEKVSIEEIRLSVEKFRADAENCYNLPEIPAGETASRWEPRTLYIGGDKYIVLVRKTDDDTYEYIIRQKNGVTAKTTCGEKYMQSILMDEKTRDFWGSVNDGDKGHFYFDAKGAVRRKGHSGFYTREGDSIIYDDGKTNKYVLTTSVQQKLGPAKWEEFPKKPLSEMDTEAARVKYEEKYAGRDGIPHAEPNNSLRPNPFNPAETQAKANPMEVPPDIEKMTDRAASIAKSDHTLPRSSLNTWQPRMIRFDDINRLGFVRNVGKGQYEFSIESGKTIRTDRQNMEAMLNGAKPVPKK
ncbi:MAG: hypothetical protein V1656_00015 [Candidatus Jorgensenbacteria bacterium]